MLKVAMILPTGEHVRVEMIQVEFVRECPYCKLRGFADVEFLTIDPDKRFCRPAHRVNYFRKTHGT